MKNHRTIILAGLCWLVPATRAGDPSIVGLWQVHFFADNGTELFQSFKQWHADGLEMEVANVNAIPDSCPGHLQRSRRGTVELVHFGWLFLDQNSPAGYLRETETISVGAKGDHYSAARGMKETSTRTEI